MVNKESTAPLACVTGSATRLGREVAFGLASKGYAIVLHYHKSSLEAIKTAARIEEMGVPVYPVSADLRVPAEINLLFEKITRIPHPLRVMVNSASIFLEKQLLDTTPGEWDDVISVNLRAPWLCSMKAAEVMKKSGVIINISDAGAGETWMNHPVYILSKSALNTLTRLLARSLAPHIRVNAIAPGLILRAEGMSPDEWLKKARKLPLRQHGKPQHVILAIDYLLKNEYITGQILAVDGGYQLM